MKNNYHIYRENHKNNNDKLTFIFFDTEGLRKKTNTGEIQTLMLGTAILWRVSDNFIEKFRFTDNNNFWDWVEKHFNEKCKEIHLVAHNVSYDAKITDMYNQLFIKRKWMEKSIYLQGKVFLIDVYKNIQNDTEKQDKKSKKKNVYKLLITDSMNLYSLKLSKIGKALKIPKGEMPTNNNIEDWFKYCENDTYILLKLFQFHINMLETNNLGSFRRTISSQSQSMFKYRFYDSKKAPLHIHNSTRANLLEQFSYRGAFSDLLQYGKVKNTKAYKVDVNSMYPAIMSSQPLPCKLLNYFTYSHKTQKEFRAIINRIFKNKDTFILHADFIIPKNCKIAIKGYVDKQEKLMTFTGYIRACLTKDEIIYILKKGGSIKYCYEMSIYKTSFFFKSFIDYFSEMKIKASKNKNEMIELFSKITNNSLYGRTAMKKTRQVVLEMSDTAEIKQRQYMEYNEEIDKTIIYTAYQFGKEIIAFVKTDERTYDNFTAIASFITAFVRLRLVELLEIAGDKNKFSESFYIDTDSLTCTTKAYANLKAKGLIDKYKLGLLKIESISPKNVVDEYYNSKFYKFGNEKLKCKGIKKDAVLVSVNSKEMRFKQENWMQTKTAFRKNMISCQIIDMQIKKASLEYTKGKVLKNNRIEPYHFLRNGRVT